MSAAFASGSVFPPLLKTEDIMRRYGYSTRPPARRRIEEAGGRKFGRDWMIRADVLDEWERRRVDESAYLGDRSDLDP